MRHARRVTYRMTVAVLDLSVPVSRSIACRSSRVTPPSSVSGERISSLSSRWCGVPRSDGADVGTSTGSSPDLSKGRWLPGWKSTASRSFCSFGAWSEWTRSSEAKKETTSGTRRYGAVR